MRTLILAIGLIALAAPALACGFNQTATQGQQTPRRQEGQTGQQGQVRAQATTGPAAAVVRPGLGSVRTAAAT